MQDSSTESANRRSQNPLETNEEEAFSARAIRSFMSRIGSGLLSAAGFELAEEAYETYVGYVIVHMGGTSDQARRQYAEDKLNALHAVTFK